MNRIKEGIGALVVAAGIALVAMSPQVAATTWPSSTNPEYTGPGSEPIIESLCVPDRCGFLTANGDRFIIDLPGGFVAKYQGNVAAADQATVQASLPVIAAMVKLPASQYAPANVSGVGGSISVAPSYATKLAAVGVTPDALLGWLESNVQPTQKAPWIPGSANAPATTTKSPANNPTPAAPTPKPGATTKPAAAYPATPPASQVPQAPPKPVVIIHQAGGIISSTATSPPTGPAKPGSVVPHATACLAGESLTVAPSGSRCMPDSALSVQPPVMVPWWKLHEWALGAALGVLIVGSAAAIALRKRPNDPYHVYR